MSQITIKVQYLRLSAASEIVLGHTCEKQKRRLKERIAELTAELEKTKADNVTLYEKI
uniref:Protein CASP isoform X2 n=1 Tax=Rhizophora mucronata TaxID=61149 RepID=A0A2P2M2G8_RHIMU